MRILQSPWVAAALGALVYLLTTVMMLRPERLLANRPATPATAEAHSEPEVPGPSWVYKNPEVDQLVSELKTEREAVKAREKELQDLATRLAVERQEIGTITQRVAVIQAEIERSMLRIKDDEAVNLKRLAKVYVSMSPEAAAKIMAEFQDDVAVKVFSLMKESETAPILEIISKSGEAAVRRVALISDRLRLMGSSNPPPTSVTGPAPTPTPTPAPTPAPAAAAAPAAAPASTPPQSATP
jgi:flagellar motility protein MotE (MotC chaperone)